MLIIAEAGINWNGNLNMAWLLIRAAKKAGADIFKTQVYAASALFGPEGVSPDPDIYAAVEWMDRVNYDGLAIIKRWCDEEGIEFMASAFDEERLSWLEDLGVRYHKLASRSVAFQRDYCEKVLSLGKPTFVSLGMWQRDGWPWSLRQYPNIRYMYCVSEYPTPLSHVHLPERWGLPGYVGFSDHTIGIGAALIAVARGAEVIEKHFTIDTSLPGPDHSCSAMPKEFAMMASVARVLSSTRKGFAP